MDFPEIERKMAYPNLQPPELVEVWRQAASTASKLGPEVVSFSVACPMVSKLEQIAVAEEPMEYRQKLDSQQVM